MYIHVEIEPLRKAMDMLVDYMKILKSLQKIIKLAKSTLHFIIKWYEIIQVLQDNSEDDDHLF